MDDPTPKWVALDQRRGQYSSPGAKSLEWAYSIPDNSAKESMFLAPDY